MLVLVLIIALPSVCQEHHSKWQVGTIMAVAPHPMDGQHHNVRRYDVSLKVGKAMYVVLYVPSDGLDTITHRAGLDVLVSVGQRTIAFNDLLGRKIEVPILSRKHITPILRSTLPGPRKTIFE
ncbi:MAG: hypothetical protein DMG64_04460 [Acidobacteria bacterium]|nr:MAG: hypothetical protein DMG64_04460 [Acidobacteriota bacterium]